MRRLCILAVVIIFSFILSFNLSLIHPVDALNPVNDGNFSDHVLRPIKDGETNISVPISHSILKVTSSDYTSLTSISKSLNYIIFNESAYFMTWSEGVNINSITFVKYVNSSGDTVFAFMSDNGTVLTNVTIPQVSGVKGCVIDNFRRNDLWGEVIVSAVDKNTKLISFYLLDNPVLNTYPNNSLVIYQSVLSTVNLDNYLYPLNLDSDDLHEMALFLYNGTIDFLDFNSTAQKLEVLGSLNTLLNPSSSLIEIGDVNNDTLDELIVSQEISGRTEIRVLGVDSNGVLKLLRVFNISATGVDINLGDVDNDEVLDLIFAYQSGSSLINITTFSFITNSNIFTGDFNTNEIMFYLVGLDVLDFDLDGKDDIILTTYELSAFQIYGLNASGTDFRNYISFTHSVDSVAVSDFNLDNVDELIVYHDNGTNKIFSIYDTTFSEIDRIVYRNLKYSFYDVVPIDRYYEKFLLTNSSIESYMFLRKSNTSISLAITEPVVNKLYITRNYKFNVSWEIILIGDLISLNLTLNSSLVDSYRTPINGTNEIILNMEGLFKISLLADVVDIGVVEVYFLTVYDITKPNITTFQPSNSTYHSTTNITVSWNTSDNVRIDNVTLYVNGLKSTVSTSTNYTTTILLPEGTHNLTLVAYDLAGNIDIQTNLIIVDLTAPSIMVVDPFNGSIVGDSKEFRWNTSDNFKVDKVEILDNGTLVSTVNNPIDSANLSFTNEGIHVIEFVVYDVAGNFNSSLIIVNVDLTPPKLTLVSPVNGSRVGRQFNLTLDVDEVNIGTVDILINGTRYTLMDQSNFTVNLSIVLENFNEGFLNLTVLLEDLAGNKADYFYLYSVDLTPPIIYVTNYQNFTYVNNTLIELNISYANFDDFAELVIYLNDQKSSFTTPQYNLSINLSNGENNITLYSFDNVGNWYKVAIIIYLDTTPPSIKVTNDKYSNEPILEINISAWDNYGIEIYQVKINETLVYNGTFANGSIPLTLMVGNNTISVTVIDKAGNGAQVTSWAVYDNTPPSIKILSPENKTYTSNYSVFLSFLTNDDLSGVNKTIVSLNETILTYNLDTLWVNLPNDGLYVVKIVAWDNAGNYQETNLIMVRDTYSPYIIVEAPNNGTITNGTFLLRIRLMEKNPSYILVLINNDTIARIDNSSQLEKIVNYDKNGFFKMVIYAGDKAGNDAFTILFLTVDKEPPTVKVSVEKINVKVNENVTIKINATDNVGIKIIEVYKDGEFYGYLVNQISEVSIQFEETGVHQVMIKAVDLAGNKATVIIEINVKKPEQGIISPLNLNLIIFFIIPSSILVGTLIGYMKTKRRSD